MIFLEGYLVGVATLFLIGPVVFTLLDSTVAGGFKAGIVCATGIIISDVICLALCFWGTFPLLGKIENQAILALAGGIIVIGLGIKYLFFTNAKLDVGGSNGGFLKSTHFIKGFLVNTINPFVFIFWIALITYVNSSFTESNALYYYLSGNLLGIYSVDLTKVFFANKLRKYLEPHRLKIFYRVIGLMLVIFSIRLFWFFFNN